MNEKIDWAKYVDRIFCVFFLPNKDRMPRIREELKRVGILDSGIFEWRFTVPSAMDKRVQDSFADKTWVESIGAINGTLEQTRILKESIHLGYNRILILEDDVAFLKDKGKIIRILDNLPNGYDVIQLDKALSVKHKGKWDELCLHSINDDFAECIGGNHFGLSDANIYTSCGMKEAVRILDAKPIWVDQMWRFGDFRWAVAKNNLCIQVFFGKSNSTSYEQIHDVYGMGVDYADYSLPEGYGRGKLYSPNVTTALHVRKTSSGEIERSRIKSGWDIFDYVGVIGYTGYRDRMDALLVELNRVGIASKAHIYWDINSPFKEKLASVVRKTRFCDKKGCFAMLLQHYNVVKTAYELGCSNVLVMEDDIRFLKDMDVIGNLLNTIPIDFDHLMLDRNPDYPEEMAKMAECVKNHKRNFWYKFSKAGSTGCYAFSRRGMKRYIDIIEKDLNNGIIHNPDYYFSDEKGGNHYWDDSYNRYCCYPHMAVQSVVGAHGSFTNLSAAYWPFLLRGGIKQEDYNLLFPIVVPENFNQVLNEKLTKNSEKSGDGETFCSENSELIRCYDKSAQTEFLGMHKFKKCYVWGSFSSEANCQSLQLAVRDNATIILCEDGLISRVRNIQDNLHSIYCKSHSLTMDTLAYHFDASKGSTLEGMLNDLNLIVTVEQRAEARRLIDRIVSNKISKYNHQPIYTPKIGRDGVHKVLVVDQSYGDRAVKLGMADDSTFQNMLDAAIRENPDADILVKTHPDTIAGKGGEKKGYYQDLKEKDNIYKISSPINPYSLMEGCDKVYVVSSQFGFEALMAGKEVHTFGMPFYAGWGLTIDAQHLDRRTNMRTLEELFYIYCCMYTHWVDPDKGCETTIDAVIDKMISLRDAYAKGRVGNSSPHVSRMTTNDADCFGYRGGRRRGPVVRPRPFAK